MVLMRTPASGGASTSTILATSANCRVPGTRAVTADFPVSLFRNAFFPDATEFFCLFRRNGFPVAADREFARSALGLLHDLARARDATGPDSKNSLLFTLFSAVAHATAPSP